MYLVFLFFDFCLYILWLVTSLPSKRIPTPKRDLVSRGPVSRRAEMDLASGGIHGIFWVAIRRGRFENMVAGSDLAMMPHNVRLHPLRAEDLSNHDPTPIRMQPFRMPIDHVRSLHDLAGVERMPS